MAKRQVGFVKIKPIWKKHFSEKELDSIWANFKKLFEDVVDKKIDWSKDSYQDFMFKNLQDQNTVPFIPETDRWDDTEGIKPKIFKKLLKEFNSEEKVFLLLRALVTQVPSIVNRRGNRYDDDYIFDNEDRNIDQNSIIKIILEEEKDLSLFLNNLLIKNLLNITDVNNLYYDFSEIDMMSVNKEKLKEIYSKKIFPKSTVLNNDLVENGLESFFNNLKKSWKRIHNFVPKEESILLLEPNKFNFKSFSQSEKMFSNYLDKSSIVDFYKVFGELLPSVVPYIKNDQLKKVNTNFNECYKILKLNKEFLKFLQLSKKGIDLQLTTHDLYHISLATQLESTKSKIQSKDRINIKEYDSMIELGKYLHEMIKNESNFKNFADINIAFDFFHDFKKYNISERHQKLVLELLSETAHLKVKKIPLLSGQVGEYKFEMLPKNDIRGLICGKATNCCQHLDGGVGKEAVKYGAKNEDSTFFIVSKKDKIVAQSWVWIKEDQFTFDSTEMLHNTEEIKECYFEYIRNAKEDFKAEGINKVTVGSNRLNLTQEERIDDATYHLLNKGYKGDHRIQTVINIEKI